MARSGADLAGTRQRPQGWLLAVVALGHVLVLATWSPLRPAVRQASTAKAEPSSLLWLLAPPARVGDRRQAAQPTRSALQPSPLSSAETRPGKASPSTVMRLGSEPALVPSPAPAQAPVPTPWTAPSMVVEPAPLAQAAPPAASAPPAPLNLHLPPQWASAPAWRSNAALAAGLRPAAGRDERLAAQLGTDQQLRLEPEGDGYRYRRGQDCLKVMPGRESGLNPWNQNAAPLPRQVAPC